jgi:hypothetical protein
MIGKKRKADQIDHGPKKHDEKKMSVKKSREYTFFNEFDLRRRVRILSRKELKGENILDSAMEIQHDSQNRVLAPPVFDLIRDRTLLEDEFERIQKFDPSTVRQCILNLREDALKQNNRLKITDICPEMKSLLHAKVTEEWTRKLDEERKKLQNEPPAIQIYAARGLKRQAAQKKFLKKNLIRENISALYLSSSLTRTQIASSTSSSLSQVNNTLKTLRKTSKVPQTVHQHPTCNRKILRSHIQIMSHMYGSPELRDLSLKRKVDYLNQRSSDSVTVSSETVRLYSKKFLKLNYKSVKFTYPNSNCYINRKRRKVIVFRILQSLNEDFEFVYVDECGIGSRSLKRKGWSRRGSDPQREGHSRGKNVSVCAAITRRCVVAMEFSSCAYNELTFTRFLTEMVSFLRGSSKFGQKPIILFMDNAAIHKTALCLEFLNKMGVSLLFNAPYTPHLNCCEYFFNDVKRELSSDSDLRM